MASPGRVLASRSAIVQMVGYALACAGLLFTALPAAASSDKVPDWVKAAAVQQLPEYPKNTKAVVLLDDTYYSVDAKGRATEHERCVVKILRPQGRKFGVPAVWYDKDSKIAQFHVWSIDPAGHEYAVKDSEISDSAAGASFELYSDTREKYVEAPGRDPGGVVAYEFTKEERPYLSETTWDFQGDIPVLKQTFTLTLPAGYNYVTTWGHHLPVTGTNVDPNTVRWEMNSESAIDLEQVPMPPSERALAGRMTVHYGGVGFQQAIAGSWSGEGMWYDGLLRDRKDASPAIAAKAAELTAGKMGFYEKTEAIGEYVQKNIRYVAIEIGIGGNQPHPAADVFRYGYGDCKDKATLLSAMLSSVGIHSTLVLVDTHRGFMDPDDPSAQGNHAIAAIEIPKGYESPKLHSIVETKTHKSYLIFDPTWEETPFGQLENELQGGYALLVEGDASEVIHLPVMPPELNTVTRTASFQLLPDGTLKGSVTEKRFGDLARGRRYLATHEDSKEQQQRMDRVVSRDFGAVSLTGLKFADATTLNKDVTTSFDLQADHFASQAGPLLMVRPRVLGSYALDVDRKVRTVAIDLEQTMRGHDEFDIEIPAGYVVDELPDPVKRDWGFASYESKTEVHGQTLHYTRTYTLREITLPPSKYRQLQDLASTIGSDEEGRVILKHAAAAPVAAAPATVATTAIN